jgi:hypothetical protein
MRSSVWLLAVRKTIGTFARSVRRMSSARLKPSLCGSITSSTQRSYVLIEVLQPFLAIAAQVYRVAFALQRVLDHEAQVLVVLHQQDVRLCCRS